MKKKVDLNDYVFSALQSEALDVIQAKEEVTVVAQQAKEGDAILSYDEESITKRVIKFVDVDEHTNEPDWIIAEVENGEIAKDEFGNEIAWLASDYDFKKNYHLIDSEQLLFAHSKRVNKFLEVISDFIFNYNGENIPAKKGSLVNITNLNNFKIVDREEFNKKYKPLHQQLQLKLK